jgi:solute carrier family 25 oxoglutarate transporter 11
MFNFYSSSRNIENSIPLSPSSNASAASMNILATSSDNSPSAAKQPLPKSVIFATSGLGGCLGWIVVHPFNTIAVRANLASASGQTFSLQKMLKKDGFKSLYDGLSAGVARQVFYATSRFGLYEIGRDLLHSYTGKTDFASRCVMNVDIVLLALHGFFKNEIATNLSFNSNLTVPLWVPFLVVLLRIFLVRWKFVW